ncbi:hypothetical protein LZ32DRAFT_424878 [Colletotrichum eremochloae]|nr:hypothetical protein LZ32DRAFT_424878 [Colletotrichum eremochloae]
MYGYLHTGPISTGQTRRGPGPGLGPGPGPGEYGTKRQCKLTMEKEWSVGRGKTDSHFSRTREYERVPRDVRHQPGEKQAVAAGIPWSHLWASGNCTSVVPSDDLLTEQDEATVNLGGNKTKQACPTDAVLGILSGERDEQHSEFVDAPVNFVKIRGTSGGKRGRGNSAAN